MIYVTLMSAIASSQTNIYITDAYFAPDRQMLHAKTTTIDGVWSTVGTSNLDWWSIARDNEVNAVVLSHSFGDDMNLMFRNDIEDSLQIEADQWKHRGFLERLHETAARAVEPLL